MSVLSFAFILRFVCVLIYKNTFVYCSNSRNKVCTWQQHREKPMCLNFPCFILMFLWKSRNIRVIKLALTSFYFCFVPIPRVNGKFKNMLLYRTFYLFRIVLANICSGKLLINTGSCMSIRIVNALACGCRAHTISRVDVTSVTSACHSRRVHVTCLHCHAYREYDGLVCAGVWARIHSQLTVPTHLHMNDANLPMTKFASNVELDGNFSNCWTIF